MTPLSPSGLTPELAAAAFAEMGPAIQQHLGYERCCIAGSKIVMLAARLCGLEADTVCVDAFATPPAWTALVDQVGFDVLSEAQGRLHPLAQECTRQHGSYVCSGNVPGNCLAQPPLRGDSTDSDFPGHVVAVIGGAWMVDVSSGQFSRPDRGLIIPPSFYSAVSPAFLADSEMWHDRWSSPGGRSGLYFIPHRQQRSYERTRAWVDPLCMRFARDIATSLSASVSSKAA